MVKKLKVKVSSDQIAMAESNGIAYNTVYTRLQRGWDLERAITEPSRKLPALAKLSRNEEGSIVASKPKGRVRSFRLDEDLEKGVDESIALSGLSMSDWLSGVVRQHLSLSRRQSKKG